MNDEALINKVNQLQKTNSRIASAMEIFRNAQKIYEESIETINPYRRTIVKGSYSSSISTKDYHANISTTTQ